MSRALLEYEAREALEKYGVPSVPGAFCANGEGLVEAADKIGYPVVIKVVSPDVVHKSDAGGVKLNIQNADELKAACEEMMASVKAYAPEADIKGVLVTKMVKKCREVIVGSICDGQFGPVVMVGLGGIFVEVFKDVSFGIAPLSEREAEKMIRSLKSFKILQGTRGEKPIDLKALCSLVSAVSKYVFENKVKELDLNPVFCSEDAVFAGDARILLDD